MIKMEEFIKRFLIVTIRKMEQKRLITKTENYKRKLFTTMALLFHIKNTMKTAMKLNKLVYICFCCLLFMGCHKNGVKKTYFDNGTIATETPYKNDSIDG